MNKKNKVNNYLNKFRIINLQKEKSDKHNFTNNVYKQYLSLSINPHKIYSQKR